MNDQAHQDGLAQYFADRVNAAIENISDERAKVFREVFSIGPWGDYSGGWDLYNIKRALAVSDDPEIVGAITVQLEERERDRVS